MGLIQSVIDKNQLNRRLVY